MNLKQTRSAARAAGIVIAITAITLFAIGMLGGPTAPAAQAQGPVPGCDLPPFSTDADDRPGCVQDPQPLEADECLLSDFFLEQPYAVQLTFQDEPTTHCFNLAATACPNGDAIQIEVIGTIVNPPPNTIVGQIVSDFSEDDLTRRETTIAYGPNEVVLFSGPAALNFDSTFDVFLFNQFAGSFDVMELPDGCEQEPAPTPTFDVAPQCDGFWVQVDGDFAIDARSSAKITARFEPVGGGDVLEYGPFDAAFLREESWSFGALFSGVPVGDYLVTVNAAGTASSGDDFDETFGPAPVTREDCVDVVINCSQGALTATPLVDLETQSSTWVDVMHDERDGFEVARLVEPATEIDLFVTDLFPPGTYNYYVAGGEAPPWEEGTVHCLQFFPRFSCSNGQVQLFAEPDAITVLSLAALREIATVSFSFAGQAPEAALPELTFLFDDPPAGLLDLEISVVPDEPGTLEFVDAQADWAPVRSVDIPTCKTTLTYECSNGQRIVNWTRDGLPGVPDDDGFDTTTQVRKTNPLPVAGAGLDGDDDPGTLLTFTVGRNQDESSEPNTPSDNGVVFTDSGTRTTERNRLDCDVDVEIYCRNGRAVIDISDFAGPDDSDGIPRSRPDIFEGFTINGESGFEPGIHPIDNALQDITISDPSMRVHLIPGESIDATIPSSNLPAEIDPVTQIDGPDCQVLVETYCASGETILRIDPGETGLTRARVFFDDFGFAFQDVTWDIQDDGVETTPQELTIRSGSRVQLAEPDRTVQDLRIDPGDEVTTVNYVVDGAVSDLTNAHVPLVCTIELYPECIDGLAVMTGTTDGSRVDDLVVTNTDTNSQIAPDEGYYVLPNDVLIQVTTTPDPATTNTFVALPGETAAPSASFALDCIVEVEVACVNGQAVLHADAGQTGAMGLQVGTQSDDFPIPEAAPELDFILTNTAADPTVEVTIIYPEDVYYAFAELHGGGAGEISGLSINDPRGLELGWEWLETDGGTEYDIANFDVPLCTVVVEPACGVGEGGLTGSAELRFSRSGLPRTPVYAQNTQLSIDDIPVSPFSDIEASPHNLEPGATFSVAANNGVWIGEPGEAQASAEFTVPYCTIFIEASSVCNNGLANVQVSVSPGGVTTLENVRGDSVFIGEFSQAFRYDNRSQPADISLTPDDDNALILSSVDGSESVGGELSVDPYVCGIDGNVVCGQGEAAGTAILDTSLIGTPPGTSISSTDVADVFGPLPAGQTITFTVSNGVWFTVNEGPVLIDQVPFCRIEIVIAVQCIDGAPIARVASGAGDYSVNATGGSPFNPVGNDDADGNDNNVAAAFAAGPHTSLVSYFSFDPPGLGMTVTIGALRPTGAIVVDADGNLIDPETGVAVAPIRCVVDPTIECAAGAAFLVVDITGTPEGTAVIPSNGEEVAQGQLVPVTANMDVYLRHTPTAQLGSSIELMSPVCQAQAELVCQTGEGGPTGSAVLRTTISPLSPAGTAISPVAGQTVPSEGSLLVSVNNQVHFTSSGAATAELTAPACVVDGTAVARCVSPGIEVEVTLSGAPAAAIIIDGVSYPVAPTDATTVISGLLARESYDISLVAADPVNVAVGAAQAISITERCTIELDATVLCLAGDAVLVTVSPTASTTGSIQSISVNGDVNLPFLVAPGATVTISVSSPDTLASDIVVPTVLIPSSCDNSLRPLAGTLYLSYETACDATGENVIVSLTTDGSAGIIALAVNGDPAAPFVVDQGSSIVVSVLTFDANDVVVIQGPELAPVCIAPQSTPNPTPTPTLPPAVVITIIDLGPAPLATPDPTPEPDTTPDPTPEPTPDPTPEPTPDPTPEPTPDPTPEPTPDPTPDPEVPGQVLSARTALRQHGPSTVDLPAACDVESIELPGAVTLVREGVTEDGLIRYTSETAQLDVGTYKETVSCGGETIEIVLFVYSQIGGARGEANSISRLALTGGVLTLVLIGVPGILARKDEEVDEI